MQNLEKEVELKETFPCPSCQEVNPVPEGKVSLEWIRQLPEPEKEIMKKKTELCSPCESTGESHPAARYCIDCDELLCKTCVDFHMKFKSTKAHKLVYCHKEDSFKGAQLLSSYLVCPNHGDRAVEVKCEVHNALCCLTCATVTHRNCQSVSEIRQLASGCRSSRQTESIRSRIEEASSCIEEIIRMNDKCHKEFDISLEDIPKVLQEIRSNMMKLYERIESFALDKVKEYKLAESGKYETLKEKWNTKFSANADLLKMLDVVLEVGTDSQVYVTIHKVKELLEDTEKELSDQGGHISGQSLHLNATDKLESIQKTELLQSLISVESVQNQHQLSKTSAYSTSNSLEELKMTSDATEENTDFITTSNMDVEKVCSKDNGLQQSKGITTVFTKSLDENKTSNKSKTLFNEKESNLIHQWLNTTNVQAADAVVSECKQNVEEDKNYSTTNQRSYKSLDFEITDTTPKEPNSSSIGFTSSASGDWVPSYQSLDRNADTTFTYSRNDNYIPYGQKQGPGDSLVIKKKKNVSRRSKECKEPKQYGIRPFEL